MYKYRYNYLPLLSYRFVTRLIINVITIVVIVIIVWKSIDYYVMLDVGHVLIWILRQLTRVVPKSTTEV